jgi:Raf kinase inhibitor-like YbhB/YbcL family protein
MTFMVSSPAFDDGGFIPTKFTCDGSNVSPPINWHDTPEGTRSIVLICDDLDASSGVWDHWILFNIDPLKGGLPEAVPKIRTLPQGESHGTNSWGRTEYGGPCPPPGKPHRYLFKLYALNKKVSILPGSRKSEVLESIKGHVLAKAELMGLYGR